MGLPMYEAMLHLSKQPKERYVEQMQALINAQWDNTITVNTVQEATLIGSLVFNDIEARVSHMIDNGTTSMKNADDFKKITYKDIEHFVSRGMYYKFEDNYWITTFTDNIVRTMKNTIIRRCNNTMRWKDNENGNIISYPCVLDYDAGSFSPQKTKDIITPNNHITIIVQGNADTNKILVNQRFLFNKRPFKIAGYNDYMQNGEIDDSTPILYFDAFLDEISPFDDIVNGVANANEHVYELNILQDNFEQVTGYVGVLEAEIKLDGEIVDKDIVWETLDLNATITQEGICTLVGVSGSQAVVRASYGATSDTITINIVAAVVSNKEMVVNPQIDTILQNRTVDIYCNVYDNDILQNDVIFVVPSGAPVDNYTLVKLTNNHYQLKNIAPCKEKLTLTFASGTLSYIMEIKLGGVF